MTDLRSDAGRMLAGVLAGGVALLDEIDRVPDEALRGDPTMQALLVAMRDYRARTGGMITRDALLSTAGDAGSQALAGEVFDVLTSMDAQDAAGVRWYADKVVDGYTRWLTTRAYSEASEVLTGSVTEEADRYGRPGRTWSGAADSREYLAARLAEIDAVDQAARSGPGVADGHAMRSVADLRAAVAAEGPPRYLLRGVWPSGAYGVLAAAPKAQKTWCAIDAAVSVASGTPWLGAVPVDVTGPVLLFAGEGGARATLRRIDAVCAGRGVDADALPLAVVTRAPHLTDEVHVMRMRTQVAEHRPVLVVLDPLYLAARGADLRDLYSMGKVLETAQHLCTDAGAALLVVHHHNRGQGTGPGRMSGAGPAEWGRVLISAEVKARHADRDHDGGTDVVTVLSVVGGEVPDQAWRVRRRVWADDPGDLASPLHVVTEAAPVVDDVAGDGGADGPRLSPAGQRFLEALTGIGVESTGPEVNDRIADGPFGNGLKSSTLSRAGQECVAAGLVVATPGTTRFAPTRWRLAAWPSADADSTTDGHDPDPDPVSVPVVPGNGGNDGAGTGGGTPSFPGSHRSHSVGGNVGTGTGTGNVGTDLAGLVPGLGAGTGSDAGYDPGPVTDRETDPVTLAILAGTSLAPAGDAA